MGQHGTPKDEKSTYETNGGTSNTDHIGKHRKGSQPVGDPERNAKVKAVLKHSEYER